MNVDREKAKRFLDMMNEAQVKLEIERSSYPESEELGESIDDDYDAAEEGARVECGLTIDEMQFIFDNLRDYQ